jgi:hypothetical protein
MGEPEYYKTVMMPVEVAVGDYCWEPHPPYRICPHFCNSIGGNACALHVAKLERNGEFGQLKPEACRVLQTQAECHEAWLVASAKKSPVATALAEWQASTECAPE